MSGRHADDTTDQARRTRRATVAIVSEGFLSRLAFGVVSLALPLFALRLGMSLPAIGALISVNVVVQLVVKPVMGRFVDRLGARPALVLAILARGAIPMLLVVASAPWQLFAIRAGYGVAQSLRDPALNVVISDAGGKSRVARTFAWYHTAKNVAASLGRGAAGVLLTTTSGNYRLTFAIAAALGLLPLVPVLAALPRTRRASRTPKPVDETHSPATVPPRRRGRPWRSARPRRARFPGPLRRVAPFTGLAFLSGATAGLMNLFPVIAVQYFGLTEAQIGVVLLASTVLVLVAGPVFGWLADTVSRTAVLRVRAASNCLSSLLYLAVPAVPAAFAATAVARGVDDLGKAAFRPAWGSVMAEVASSEPTRRGSTLALIELGEDAGDALGPTVAGLLLAVGGLPALLLVRAGMAVATEIWTRAVTSRIEGGQDPEPAAPHPVPAVVPPAQAAASTRSRPDVLAR